MSDDRAQGHGRERDERFEDALDEIFGPAERDPAPETPQPSVGAKPPEDTPQIAPEPPAPSSASNPVPPAPSSPRQQGRSAARSIGIGCAVGVGGIFLCLVLLAIIGFVTGEDNGTTYSDIVAVALGYVSQGRT